MKEGNNVDNEILEDILALFITDEAVEAEYEGKCRDRS